MVRSLVRAAAAVLMLGSVAMLATATGASAKTAPAKTIIPFAGEFHPITNAGHSGECLQPLTPDFRAPIVQRPCDGSAALLWATLSTPTRLLVGRAFFLGM